MRDITYCLSCKKDTRFIDAIIKSLNLRQSLVL